jgi:alanine racemase
MRLDDRPTVATIHLGAIRANYAELARLAAGREVIAVVKSDAYGHGAAPVARTLLAAGCSRLAVATVGEGRALRAAGIGAPILVLGGVHEAAEDAIEAGLTPVVHHLGDVERLAKSRRGAPIPVHVEVDTGMRRMGAPMEEAVRLLESVAREPALRLEGVYTHLARADEPDLGPTLEQAARLRELLASARARGVRPGLVHCANSAGVLVGAALAAELPEAGAVRPGLALYGVRPAAHLAAALRPAMTLRTRVAHLRVARPGDAVGYHALYRAPRHTWIATLPVGYADGVPIAASNRGAVLIRGRRFSFAGRVSMDFVGVDVGELPVEIGDEAILFGAAEQGTLPVEEAALAAGTIAYELLVRVGPRVPRIHVE